MDRPHRLLWPAASLLLVAAALILSIVGLVTAPKVGAASDVIAVDPMELTVSEPNEQGVFTVTLDLNDPPTDTVTIALSVTDATECSVEPLILEFTPTITQAVVTVSAEDDDVIDGDQICIVETGLAVSNDPTYSGEDADDVTVTVTDDEDPLNASIGDYVWHDQNGDGLQDIDEVGLQGVTVFLDIDEDGLFDTGEPSATTNATGTYTITNLAAGVYSVQVDSTTIPEGFYLTTGNLPHNVSLGESDVYTGADFGYDDDPEDASIGDYVWYDQNGDGLQDIDEVGLQGVTVFLDIDEDGLFDTGEPSATTDEDGEYRITGLAAAEYLVRVDASTVPPGYDLTTNNLPLTVTLDESERYDEADFGYDDDPEDASIGDYVWYDQDGDGTQDGTESGLTGVTVFLDLNGNTLRDTGEPFATTDLQGAYQITGLAAGVYSVHVDPTTIPEGFYLTTGNLPLPVTLGESEAYSDADFGFDDDPENASIGDYVWYDRSGDAVQDETESGLQGITVFLDLNGNTLRDTGEPSAATDEDGEYRITGLAAGTYPVRVDATTVPAGYDLTTGTLPLIVILAESERYDEADFGYDDDPENAAIGDYVWYDRNGDAVQDETESGLQGITVFLDLNGNTLRDTGEPSATTGADGIYAITGLAADTYPVRVDASTVPTGYDVTTGTPPLNVVLAEGQYYDEADFGYDDDPEDASIGDYVWVDRDGDGLQDGTESGLQGVTVFLDLDLDGIFDDGERFATTDALGAYAITGLAAGEYLVRVDASTVPAGYDLTTGNIPLSVILGESDQYDEADFGYDDDPEDAAIGDYVWYDRNGDGLQDTGEVGLSGVVVYLDLNADGTLDTGEPYATTDEDGEYRITGLAAGTYPVRVDASTIPAGYDLTTGNIPLPVTLGESQHYDDADFGYDDDPEDASIGDYVWYDRNGDGTQDATETGLPGVTVFLDLNGNTTFDDGEPSSTTGADGIYAITGLAAGTYPVRTEASTVPAGYDLTTGSLPLSIILGESQYYDQADFGYDDDPEDASIGDYVWFDRDGDGLQDANEDGFPGVVVYLDLNADNTLDQGEPYATANGYGQYSITGLAAGSYSVRVHAATIPAGYDLTTGNLPLPVTLDESEQYEDADFGYDDDPEGASIGDYVWLDQDANGLQDATETGLPGVTVFLDLNGDTTFDEDEPFAITDAAGQYRITGLAAGSYRVRIIPDTVPTGYELTTDNLPLTVYLAEEQYYDDADFGYEGYTLARNVIGSGSILATPDQLSYGLDTTVILATTADPGWTFDSWTGPDAPSLVDNQNGTWSLLMDGDKDVTAVFSQDEYLLIVNVDGQGSVDVDPEQSTYHYGDEVTLTANADPGWTFSGWTGDLVSVSNPLIVTIHSSLTLTATITQDEYSVDIAISGHGSVSKDPNQDIYQYGDEVVLHATPDPGWRFVGWTGDLSGTANPATLTVLREMSVVAIFAEEDYTLTVNIVGNGSVSKEPNQVTYHYGDEVTLTATPASGWGFDGWTGDLEGATNPAVLLIDDHKTVTAVFETQHDLVVNTVGSGSVLLDPPGDVYSHGTVVQLTAISGPGFTFSGWSGDLSGTDNPAFLTIDRDMAVTAHFVFRVYLPVILNRWPPTLSAPSLYPIENADGNGSYTVSWSASSGADTYVLEEATDSAFSSAAIIYTGPSTSYAVSGRGAARYYYRVKARSIWNESGWSNVRYADVLWEAEPNDVAAQANGPIVPMPIYYGMFPNSGDLYDYYFFDLAAAYRVELWLTNIPSGQDYNLVLRDASLKQIGYSGNVGSSAEHILTAGDLAPGRYYIQVWHYSSGGSTQPYHLQLLLQ